MKKSVWILLFLVSTVSALATTNGFDKFQMKQVTTEVPFLSNDGSIIKNMAAMDKVQSVHCVLKSEGVIQASRHKTVSQIWYVLSGEGELWLEDPKGAEKTILLTRGTSFNLPLGYSFQFKNTGSSDLELFIVNTAPWSGDGELINVKNHWVPKLSKL